jgi:chemotaxis-related protein WspD
MRASLNDCWRRIGVAGDRQCPELNALGHCRNCSRYAELAVQMLDRPSPDGYIEQATESLAAGEEPEAHDTLATIVFRVGGEWLALPADVFEEASPLRPIRPLPQRSGSVLLGLVNVRGSLQLCVSLAALLGVDQAAAAEQSPTGAGPRLLVISRDGDRWAFAVDEVCGVHRVVPQSLMEVPTTAAKTPLAPAKAIFPWRQAHAGLLDDQRLFEALRRTVQ